MTSWDDLGPAEKAAVKYACETDHLFFTRLFFKEIGGAPFIVGPHHKVIAKALDRVLEGKSKRLLINVPPGFSKTEMTVVAFIARALAKNPRAKFIHASFSNELVNENSVRTKDIIASEPYQAMWGVTFKADQSAKGLWKTEQGGGLLAKPAGGPITGFRAGLMEEGFTGALIIDDPLKPDDADSELEREKINQRWHSTFKSRLALENTTPVIVIMQRLHLEDFSGFLLTGGAGCRWDHLMLPVNIDNSEPYPKEYTHGDPIEHGLPDGPLWQAKIDAKKIAELRLEDYTFASQYAQAPKLRGGGGIIKREWWNTWDPPDGKFPPCEYVVASLDSAYTEKEENDPSGFTVWGVFRDQEKQTKVILLYAWRKRLELHGPDVAREPGETDAQYIARAKPSWGLVEWVAYSCKRFKVDRLLIEAKASGLSVAQEMRRLHANEQWTVEEHTPEGDKVARAYAVQPMFSKGLVYAPDREWADLVIDEMSAFPKGRYRDLTDSTTQALKHFRQTGIAVTPEERAADELHRSMHRSRSGQRPLYPV